MTPLPGDPSPTFVWMSRVQRGEKPEPARLDLDSRERVYRLQLERSRQSNAFCVLQLCNERWE